MRIRRKVTRHALKRKWEHHSLLETNQLEARAGTCPSKVGYRLSESLRINEYLTSILLSDAMTRSSRFERKNEMAEEKVSRLTTSFTSFKWILIAVTVLLVRTAVLPNVACRPWSRVHRSSQVWDRYSSQSNYVFHWKSKQKVWEPFIFLWLRRGWIVSAEAGTFSSPLLEEYRRFNTADLRVTFSEAFL